MSDDSTRLSKLDANQVLRMSYDDGENRLRVAADIVATIGDIDVHIDAAAGDNVAIADPAGTNYLLPNPDGSINVNANVDLDQADDSVAIGDGTTLAYVDPGTRALLVTLDSTNLTTKNVFNEIDNVANGVTSTIISYSVPANTKLLSLDFGGTNVASYSLYIDNVLSAKKYTFFQNLNERFDFKEGMPVPIGSTITLEVIHNRPDIGSFNCNMLVLN